MRRMGAEFYKYFNREIKRLIDWNLLYLIKKAWIAESAAKPVFEYFIFLIPEIYKNAYTGFTNPLLLPAMERPPLKLYIHSPDRAFVLECHLDQCLGPGPVGHIGIYSVQVEILSVIGVDLYKRITLGYPGK